MTSIIGFCFVWTMLTLAVYDWLKCFYARRSCRLESEDVKWVQDCCSSCGRMDIFRGN